MEAAILWSGEMEDGVDDGLKIKVVSHENKYTDYPDVDIQIKKLGKIHSSEKYLKRNKIRQKQ